MVRFLGFCCKYISHDCGIVFNEYNVFVTDSVFQAQC